MSHHLTYVVSLSLRTKCPGFYYLHQGASNSSNSHILLVGNVASELAVRVDCGFGRKPAEDCLVFLKVNDNCIHHALVVLLYGTCKTPWCQDSEVRFLKSKMQEAQRGSSVPGASAPTGSLYLYATASAQTFRPSVLLHCST